MNSLAGARAPAATQAFSCVERCGRERRREAAWVRPEGCTTASTWRGAGMRTRRPQRASSSGSAFLEDRTRLSVVTPPADTPRGLASRQSKLL